MINDDKELEATVERVQRFEQQVARLRNSESNSENYRMSAGGFLAEIERMNLEIRDYLWSHPADRAAAAV
jgi:archaellum component FlaC